jgi:hypothetical protein
MKPVDSTFQVRMMNRRFRKALLAGLISGAALSAACDEDPSGPSLVAPTGVQVTALSPSSVRVTFNAVSGATGYVVQRADGTSANFATVGEPAATSHDDTGLNPATAYRYRVATRIGGETSTFSAEANVTTPGPGSVTIDTDITVNRTLYADTVYTLKGFIHVANGATLTIQPGTRIIGDFSTLGSSLFILRGSRIRAMGTSEKPIVFTSSRAAGQRQPGDWGGLILVGNARINRAGNINIEGTNTGASNPAVNYGGGTDDTDSSGELHYVRVEFAGFGPAPNQELNSFTFAAVGSGTQLDHLQSMAGLDDAFEFFGGRADAKYLVSYESGDDHFDMSEGYSGRLQYLIAYQSKVLVPRNGAGNVSGDPQGIENDGCDGPGCTDGQLSQPYTMPLVANFTLVGTGPGPVDATSGGYGMVLRRGTGGFYVNGLVTNWPKAAISIRDQASTGARIANGDFVLRSVLSSDNATLFQSGQITIDATANALETASTSAAQLFSAFSADPSSETQLDWMPAANSAARTGGLTAFTGALATRGGTVVTGTAFRGAVDPAGAKWWQGWTIYADN